MAIPQVYQGNLCTAGELPVSVYGGEIGTRDK
jgi:hypothetical protein